MLGPDLLCAPVAVPGGGSRHWLPPGKWRDYFTGEVLAGPKWVEKFFPLHEMPLYMREGADAEIWAGGDAANA